MRRFKSAFRFVLIVSMVMGFALVQVEETQANPVVCSKGLPFSICNNSSALHGQIMLHNMTDRSYNVKVYHHGMEDPDVHHVMPNSGWTFTGVLQGQRMILASPMSGGKTFEGHVMVVGAMQHRVNITNSGLTQTDGH